MHDIIKILRSISILGFLFANIFMGIFFHHFISNIPIFIYVIINIITQNKKEENEGFVNNLFCSQEDIGLKRV